MISLAHISSDALGGGKHRLGHSISAATEEDQRRLKVTVIFNEQGAVSFQVNMWRLNKVRHKAGRQGGAVEEFKIKRRDQEKGAC